MYRRRSGCPINLTLETFGDRWSLIVLRDMMFGDARTFRALLAGSLEGIASNILADRLKRLTDTGLLTRCGDPGHQQRIVYSLTESAIGLVPLMAAMGSWGIRHATPTPELAIRAELLEAGGPPLWADFMAELRHRHLGGPPPAHSVLDALQSAYLAKLAASTPRAIAPN
jgi:DNA-binding HxlR family transcriptional regulator